MTSADIIGTLADLTFVMDFHEKLGTTKNALVLAEFQRLHANLLTTLEKENEARTSNDDLRRLDKNGAGE